MNERDGEKICHLEKTGHERLGTRLTHTLVRHMLQLCFHRKAPLQLDDGIK